MKKNKKIILSIIFFIGLIVPFIPTVTVIEMFFLLIPFGIIFIVTLIYLVISFLNKNINNRKSIFIFSLLPTFVLSQLLSGFTVDKIQRIRSEKFISEIEKQRTEMGNVPENFETSLGIEYIRMNDKENYVIRYSRGFMVTEKYQSKYKHWKGYGWND